MPEVNTRFEQLLHGDVSQKTSFLSLHPLFKVRTQDCFPVPAPEHGKNYSEPL
jgi:hypothetical protein